MTFTFEGGPCLQTHIRIACLAVVFVIAAGPAVASSASLGFVVSSWGLASYETKFWDECPEGTGITNDEMWLKGLTAKDRERLTKNGSLEALSRQEHSYQRGATGQDICWDPTHFKDPPLRVVEGKTSFGLNLDGESEGNPTPKTCAHENFVSPDGEIGIDNQMYRVLGCQNGWRNGGVLETYADQERTSSGRGLILIEITEIDDPLNDDDVQVAFYRSLDPMIQDSAGHIIPFSSYRADQKRYGEKASGKIVNGIVTTQSADVTLPYYGNESYSEMVFRDMSLRLEIAPDGTSARAILAGYYDLESWWHRMRSLEYLNASYDINCPAIYEAAHRLADGYPDPETGKCTAISSAYNLTAVAGFINHNKPAADKSVKNSSGSLRAEKAR